MCGKYTTAAVAHVRLIYRSQPTTWYVQGRRSPFPSRKRVNENPTVSTTLANYTLEHESVRIV